MTIVPVTEESPKIRVGFIAKNFECCLYPSLGHGLSLSSQPLPLPVKKSVKTLAEVGAGVRGWDHGQSCGRDRLNVLDMRLKNDR